MSEGVPSAEDGASQDKKNRIVAGVAVAAVVVVVLVAVLTGAVSPGGPSAYDARSACEDFADSRLKAPASADYDLSATESGDSWTVTGTVDAENSFGANIRSTVTCNLHFEGDTARLDDISID